MSKRNLSSLQWRQNEHNGVWNHQHHERLIRRRSKKTPKFRVTGLCEGNSPVTGDFLARRASNAESVSIWWRHHVNMRFGRICYVCDKPLACCHLAIVSSDHLTRFNWNTRPWILFATPSPARIPGWVIHGVLLGTSGHSPDSCKHATLSENKLDQKTWNWVFWQSLNVLSIARIKLIMVGTVGSNLQGHRILIS